MYLKNTVKAIPLTVLNTNTLTGVYVLLSAGLPQPCFYLRIYNASTVGLTISYDNGTTDHDFIPPATTIAINAQTNSQPNNQVALFAKGQSIFIKGTVGVGSVYLTGYFQPVGA
jgi:hypothetical protein